MCPIKPLFFWTAHACLVQLNKINSIVSCTQIGVEIDSMNNNIICIICCSTKPVLRKMAGEMHKMHDGQELTKSQGKQQKHFLGQR